MKVDIKDYELMKDMAYDNREKFQMLHAKMLLIKEGESTLKEMYYDLVKKYQRKNQECEKVESRADELKNTLTKVNEKINRIVEIDGNAFDEALTNEIESIQNLIRKAIFETGENE